MALLEFALVMPLLVLLIAGMVQYGIIAATTAALTNLSREGARFAALSGTNNDDAIKTHIKNAAAFTRVKGDDLTITISPDEDTRAKPSSVGNDVKVTISYDLLAHQRFLPGTEYLLRMFSNGGEGMYQTQTTMRIQPT